MVMAMGRSLKTSRSMAAARARNRSLQESARQDIARAAAQDASACGHTVLPGEDCHMCSFMEQMKLARRWAG